ncbi:hypothetical protein JCM18899A_10430 [Nocardioides sp. AN3]
MEIVEAPRERIRTYLDAISEELSPGSSTFFVDLDAFAPTREVYRDNTRIAAQRVADLLEAAIGNDQQVPTAFVGAVAAQTMEGIHRGDIRARANLSDAEAYRALADLVLARIPADEAIHRKLPAAFAPRS